MKLGGGTMSRRERLKKKQRRCKVCKKVCSSKDYYELCAKCQPAWQIGRLSGMKYMKKMVEYVLNKEK